MPDTAVDRRLARGEETRRRLAEAMISLLEDGTAQPAAREIAERAGVSLRLVFHHFEDMEQLLRSAVGVQVERHWSRLRPVDPALPRRERIDRIMRQRETLYEAIAPVRRAAARMEDGSATLAAELDHSRTELRHGLATAFASETSGDPALIDALEVATCWETWDHLRRRMALGRTAARKVMARMVEALLEYPGGTA